MSASGEVTRLSEGETPRYSIYDLKSGRPYVMVVYPTLKDAEDDLRDLLKPYPVGHEWRERLVARDTVGCRSTSPKHHRCNLVEGHEGPHSEMTWYGKKGRGRQAIVWFDKKTSEGAGGGT